MSWLAWAGILLRFLYIASGIKGLVDRYRARQDGKRDEQLERATDVLEETEGAHRIRTRIDSDPAYRDELYERYRRR